MASDKRAGGWGCNLVGLLILLALIGGLLTWALSSSSNRAPDPGYSNCVGSCGFH